MATEDFEGGSAGAEILSSNSIFNPLFGGPEFTASPVHGGSLAGTGGDGFFFDPGSSSMVYYLDNAPNAQVWADCAPGTHAGSKNVLQEIFGSTTHTNDGSYIVSTSYNAVDDKYYAVYYDESFAFSQVEILDAVEGRGWLKLQIYAVSDTTRNWQIWTEAGTQIVDFTAMVYDPGLMPGGGFFTTGYSLGVMSSAKGAPFDVVVDDFMCPIEDEPPVEFTPTPIRRVYPRGNPGRIYPPDRSQQRTNRAGGGTYF